MTENDTAVGSTRPTGWSTPALAIECLYQPIVHLATCSTVGYEALARWPASFRCSPDRMFAAARRLGTLDDLDRAAQMAAVRGARAGGLPSTHTLFVNVEADTSSDLSLVDTIAEAAQNPLVHNVVIELTERTLLVDPARVIEITDTARSLGVGVALDDVGSNPDSLTMLEFVAPDVIKIDARLIQNRELSRRQAATIDSVSAYAESSPGTIVVAEGIEDCDDLDQATALGATHGQGWLLGRPAQLPRHFEDLTPFGGGFTTPRPFTAEPTATPTSLLAHLTTQVARKGLLIGLTRNLEDAAARLGEPVTMIVAFQEAQNFTPDIAARFSAIAAAHPHGFIAALGVGMPSHPIAHVHGTDISADEHLADDWIITVVGPHYYGALIARDRGDTCSDLDRRYDYILTHDRAIVTAAARILMRRSRTRIRPNTGRVARRIGVTVDQPG